MSAFIVQIRRGEDWNKLTTIKIEDTGAPDRERNRDKARLKAAECMRGWRDYFGSDHALRIHEEA